MWNLEQGKLKAIKFLGSCSVLLLFWIPCKTNLNFPPGPKKWQEKLKYLVLHQHCHMKFLASVKLNNKCTVLTGLPRGSKQYPLQEACKLSSPDTAYVHNTCGPACAWPIFTRQFISPATCCNSSQTLQPGCLARSSMAEKIAFATCW